MGWKIQEDENIVEDVGWRRILCASQCVLRVAGGTWGLVADLAFMASQRVDLEKQMCFGDLGGDPKAEV